MASVGKKLKLGLLQAGSNTSSKVTILTVDFLMHAFKVLIQDMLI